MPEITREQVLEYICGLSVSERNALTAAVDERVNRCTGCDHVVLGPHACPGLDPDPNGQRDFTVVLVSAGERKIAVIIAIRPIMRLGLKEAKDFVDDCYLAPRVIREAVSKNYANEIKAKLESFGAKVEIK